MRALAFALSFGAYTAIHTARKSLSVIKPVLIQTRWLHTGGDDDTLFGTMDALFMAVYGVGNLASGHAADRFDRRRLLAGSLVGSALCVALFAAVGYASWRSPLVYICLWALEGLAQSAAYPCIAATLAACSAWFGRRRS